MLKKTIVFTFSVLMAFQSVFAIADMHQSHQSGLEHLEFTHNHDGEINQEKNLLGESDYDCHHCCHCHGPSFSAIASGPFSLTINIDQHLNTLPFSNYSSKNFSLLLRPPIV